jgi:hypothetical protein
MIDNYDKILPLLEYPSKDVFYSVQVLQRKKDNANAKIRLGKNNNSRTIKSYYVTSNEMLLELKEEMTKLAELFTARVSINLNPKSFEKAALENNELIGNYLKGKSFKHIKNSYDRAVAKSNIRTSVYRIVDIDEDELEQLDNIVDYINELYEEARKFKADMPNKICAMIPSKSGMHIIANPFNKKKFKDKFPSIEIHNNNPTNLYIP